MTPQELRARVEAIREEALAGRYNFAAIADCLNYITRLEAVAGASKVVLEFTDDLPKDNLHAALKHAGWSE